MPKRRPDQSDSDVGEMLQQLRHQIAALTDAVDRLGDEVQWRNNERRNGVPGTSPPFVLHSMPADPTTDDWQINRVRPDRPAEPDRPADAKSDGDDFQLKQELSELRQYLAALVLITACGDEPEFRECESWLIEWASREFDPDMLRLAMPDPIVATIAPAIPSEPQRADRQQHLFDEGDADDDRSAG